MSPEVTDALVEQQRLVAAMQDEEEQARLRASAFITPQMETAERSRTTGTLGETLDAKAKWGKKLDDGHKKKVMEQAELDRHAELVRKLEKKLAFVSSSSLIMSLIYPIDKMGLLEKVDHENLTSRMWDIYLCNSIIVIFFSRKDISMTFFFSFFN